MKCLHKSFRANCAVGRLMACEADEANPDAAPRSFIVDVQITCTDCGEPFTFIGLPAGCSAAVPMVSVDGTEARLPIRPSSAAPGEFEPSGLGFTVQINPGEPRGSA